MSNVPTDPYSEEAWSEIIGNPLGIRSVHLPTEVFSIFVYAGRDLVATPFDNLPFRAITLRNFVVPGLANMPAFALYLLLVGKTSASREVHSVSFPVRWSSRHSRSNGDVVFLYRPEKIFVRVPVTDESGSIDRLPNTTSVGKQSLIPIHQVISYPAIVLDRFTRPKALGKSRFFPVSPTNGFSGTSKTVYPQIQEIDVLDAHFPPVGFPYLDGQRKLQVFYKDRASVSTPGFRTLSKGKLPVNPFSFTQVRTDDMPSSSVVTFPPPSGLVSSDFYGSTAYTFVTPPALPGFNSSVKNKALSNLIKKAEEDISANLAQDFAQYGQTVRLITGNATKIANAIAAVKRGDVGKAINILAPQLSQRSPSSKKKKGPSASKSTADSWLELQYGWKPLLQDIEEAMRILAYSIIKKPSIVTVRSGSHKEIKSVVRTEFFPGKKDILMDITNYYSCRVGVRYSHRSELVNYLQQTGFTNPINLGWEILPYSFVVDWFIPIGPYLETLSAWQSKVFIGGFITQFSKGEVSCGFDLTSDPYNGGYIRTVKGGYKRSSVEVRRDPLGTFPRFDLPKPKNPVSIVHALNAIALVTSRFAK